jgi:hypothetical protein
MQQFFIFFLAIFCISSVSAQTTPVRKKIIAVVGDNNLPDDHPNCKLAEALGQALVDNGYRIIHGGRGGIMKAVAKGARRSGRYHDGTVIAILPGFDPSGANEYSELALPTGLDTYRNFLIANAEAVVAIGGGAGTLSEMAMAWILKRMVIGYAVAGWSGRLADQRIDDKKRVDWPDDRVVKVENEQQVLDALRLYLHHYAPRYTGLVER